VGPSCRWSCSESREMYFGREQGDVFWEGAGMVWVLMGSSQNRGSVSHLGPQANKYNTYREVRPNQAA